MAPGIERPGTHNEFCLVRQRSKNIRVRDRVDFRSRKNLIYFLFETRIVVRHFCSISDFLRDKLTIYGSEYSGDIREIGEYCQVDPNNLAGYRKTGVPND